VAHTHTDLGTDYGDRVQSKSLGLYDKCKWLFRLHTARVAGQIFRAHIKILFISEQDATHDRTVGKYLEEIPFQCLGVYEIRESFVRNVIGLDVIYEIDNIYGLGLYFGKIRAISGDILARIDVRPNVRVLHEKLIYSKPLLEDRVPCRKSRASLRLFDA
jgi:hypothetical protein